MLSQLILLIYFDDMVIVCRMLVPETHSSFVQINKDILAGSQ
jgi:hypothetical protein